jgi:hypothetical protein
VQAEGVKGVQNRIGRAGLLAWRVKIFYPQQPLPIARTHIEIACQCGKQRAEMEWAGR